MIRIRSLLLALAALIGAMLAGIGFLILVRPRSADRPWPLPASDHISTARCLRFSSILTGSSSQGRGVPSTRSGWILLSVGLIGLVVALSVWRPWSSHRNGIGSIRTLECPAFSERGLRRRGSMVSRVSSRESARAVTEAGAGSPRLTCVRTAGNGSERGLVVVRLPRRPDPVLHAVRRYSPKPRGGFRGFLTSSTSHEAEGR